MKICGVEMEVFGEPPAKGSGSVVCYNESCLVDVLAYGIKTTPHLEKVTVAEIFSWIPFSTRAYPKNGFEVVPRGKRTGTNALINRMVECLRQGERVGWGGEGGQSAIDGVGHFKRGAALVAIRAQVPIVPLAICGGHRVMRHGSLRARPGLIRLSYLDPIPTTGLTEDDARDLADKVQAIVADEYARLRKM